MKKSRTLRKRVAHHMVFFLVGMTLLVWNLYAEEGWRLASGYTLAVFAALEQRLRSQG